MNELIKKLDKKYGPNRVFWGLIVIFVIVVLIGLVVVDATPSSQWRRSTSGGVAPYGDTAMGKIAYPSIGTVSQEMSQGMMNNIYPVPPPIFYGGYASSKIMPSGITVIRNGSLDLVVENSESALGEIRSITQTNGGFIEYSVLREVSDGVKSGHVTIRIPQDNFDTVFSALKLLARKVNHEVSDVHDMSALSVDLEAQIVNLRAEEEQYRKLLDGSKKIEDTLLITARLSDVRIRIDMLEGQLNNLARESDMASISISLTSEADVEVFGIIWKPLTVLKHALKTMLADLITIVNWLIFFVFRLPGLVITVALLVLFFVVIYKVALWLKVVLTRL